MEFITQIYARWVLFSTQSMSFGVKTLEKCSLRWFKDLIDTHMFAVFHKIIMFQDKELKKVVEENKQNYQRSDVVMTLLSQYTNSQEAYKSLVMSLRKLVEQEEKEITINKETINEILTLFSEKEQVARFNALEEKLVEVNVMIERSMTQLPNL